MNSLRNSVTTSAKRSHRRLLVIVFYGLLVLGGVLSTTRFDPGFWGGFLLAGVFTILLLLSTAGIIVTPSNKLDERQQHLQNVTFRSAYRVLIGLALVSLPLAFNPSWLAGVPAYGLLSVVIALVILLPVTVVAWTEPDPVEEDASVEHARRLA